MKLVEKNLDFHSRGVQSKAEYKVSSSTKLMDMLSNMLYSDKIAAPIRELSTNAWDAHIMSGNTSVSPDVYLPTTQEPTFKIRDYGTGLSPEQIENMYTTYGESNKNDSNDYNGCMGIGSKSPFAYTSSFTTTSYYNGMKYVYVNSKDKLNCPSIHLLHSEPTEEPNGLEISFTCLNSDFSVFASKAADILQWFPLEFNIIRSNNVFSYYNQQNYKLDKGDWKLRGGYNSSSYAVMGNVCYPIDTQQIVEQYCDEGDKDVPWYRKKNTNIETSLLSNLSLELHFDIGEVEMAISREELQYTELTINSIKKKLSKIKDYFVDYGTNALKDEKCLWDAKVSYLRIVRELGINYMNIPFFYNGTEIKDPACRITYDKDRICIYKFSHNNNPIKEKHYSNTIYLDIVDTKFVENDVKLGAHAASKEMMTNGECSRVVLVKFDDDTERTKFCSDVGINKDMLILASGVVKKRDKVKRATAIKRPRDIGKLFAYNHLGCCFARESTDKNINDGGVYVEVNRWEWRAKGYFKDESSLARIRSSLKDFGIDIGTIYGVKTKDIKKFKDNPKWKSVDDIINDNASKILIQGNVDKHQKYSNRENTSNLVSYKKVYDFTKDTECKFNEIVEHLIDNEGCEKTFKNINILRNYSEDFIKQLNKLVEKYRYNVKYNDYKIEELYPVFTLVHSKYISTKDAEIIANIILNTEEANKQTPNN